MGGTAAVGVTAPSSRVLAASSFTSGTVPLTTSWTLTGDATKLARYEVQISIDGGSYKSVALASATSRNAVTAATPGDEFKFRARAIDKAGRASAWVAGPTFSTSAVQESTSAAAWTGTWVTAGHTAYLGGQARASQVNGAQVTYTFSGRSFALVGPTGPTRGKAYVYLDGKLLITIDTYSSTFVPRRVLQTIFTSDGKHTVTIRSLGTSGRPWVAVDAFFVLKRE